MKYATITKKGINCHKDYYGVMANSGFSGVVTYKYGMTIYIPKHGIKKNGAIKKVWQNRLNNMTVQDALWLNERIAA